MKLKSLLGYFSARTPIVPKRSAESAASLSSGKTNSTFLPSFKNLITTVFANEIQSGQITRAELDDLFTDVDTLSLIAFDLYSESRDLIYNLRIAQIKEMNEMLQKANLLNESVDTSTFMRCSNYIEEEKEI